MVSSGCPLVALLRPFSLAFLLCFFTAGSFLHFECVPWELNSIPHGTGLLIPSPRLGVEKPLRHCRPMMAAITAASPPAVHTSACGTPAIQPERPEPRGHRQAGHQPDAVRCG